MDGCEHRIKGLPRAGCLRSRPELPPLVRRPSLLKDPYRGGGVGRGAGGGTETDTNSTLLSSLVALGLHLALFANQLGQSLGVFSLSLGPRQEAC